MQAVLQISSFHTAVCTADVLVLFEELNDYLRKQGFRRMVYRAIPWVYHRLPSEEDLYAMFWKCGARTTVVGCVRHRRPAYVWSATAA